jgi:hypothetical protein
MEPLLSGSQWFGSGEQAPNIGDCRALEVCILDDRARSINDMITD